MRNKLFVIVLAALFALPCVLYAAEQDCSTYHVSTSVIGNTLRYDMSRQGTVEPPYVDSIWITDKTDSILYVSYVQSGEEIDISEFERGYYILWVRVKECLLARRFGKSTGDVTIVGETKEEKTLPIKTSLRGGQILILRGGHTYTLSGQEVK